MISTPSRRPWLWFRAGYVWALTVSFGVAGCAVQTPVPGCDYDRAAIMQLGERDFDQPTSPGDGWRGVAAREGCGLIAADLIRDYRQAHGSRSSLLYWHEAQLRAMANQVPESVALMRQSLLDSDPSGWNAYVEATIAFLLGDQRALIEARVRLLETPPPRGANVRSLGNGYVELSTATGAVSRRRWPPNLDIVDGLIRCFGKSYGEAYSSSCRAKPIDSPAG